MRKCGTKPRFSCRNNPNRTKLVPNPQSHDNLPQTRSLIHGSGIPSQQATRIEADLTRVWGGSYRLLPPRQSRGQSRRAPSKLSNGKPNGRPNGRLDGKPNGVGRQSNRQSNGRPNEWSDRQSIGAPSKKSNERPNRKPSEQLSGKSKRTAEKGTERPDRPENRTESGANRTGNRTGSRVGGRANGRAGIQGKPTRPRQRTASVSHRERDFAIEYAHHGLREKEQP